MTTTARANDTLQVLENPFPVPEIDTIWVQKEQANQTIGVSFTMRDRGFVEVTRVHPYSPLLGTTLRAGQQILAINGIPIKTSTQAVEAVKSAPRMLQFSVIKKIQVPFCKMVAVPVWKHHPGVVFESTRGRSLVQVSRIFPKGPFSDSDLREDDLVLAVNGFPVSIPEQADRALELHRNQPNAFVYALSIRSLRQSIIQETIQTNKQRYSNIFFEVLEDGHHCIHLNDSGKQKSPRATCVFDRETHELRDPESFLHLVAQSDMRTLSFQNPNLFYKGKYGSIVRPFFKDYNYIMERRIRELEEVVCCEAWKCPIPSSNVVPAATQVLSSSEVEPDVPIAVARMLSVRGTSYATP